jgi:hypothetical protein
MPELESPAPSVNIFPTLQTPLANSAEQQPDFALWRGASRPSLKGFCISLLL